MLKIERIYAVASPAVIEFVIIARKTGELSEEKRKEAYKIFNETIDRFLLDDEDEEE